LAVRVRHIGANIPVGTIDIALGVSGLRFRDWGWGPGFNLPKAKMVEDLSDDVLLLDDRDDPHQSVALRIGEGGHLINLLYQSGPILPAFF
jgi:hypothetical protein